MSLVRPWAVVLHGVDELGGRRLAMSRLTAGPCHHHLVSSPLIDKGVAALRAGDAVTARRVFELAVAEVKSGVALEGLAEALYLQQEYSAAAAHYERKSSLPSPGQLAGSSTPAVRTRPGTSAQARPDCHSVCHSRRRGPEYRRAKERPMTVCEQECLLVHGQRDSDVIPGDSPVSHRGVGHARDTRRRR